MVFKIRFARKRNVTSSNVNNKKKLNAAVHPVNSSWSSHLHDNNKDISSKPGSCVPKSGESWPLVTELRNATGIGIRN